MPWPQKSRSQKTSINMTTSDESTGICCPVPIIVCAGKERAAGDPGIRMYCTNVNCTVSKVRIHSGCFKKLEENLIKSLNGSGRSRRWTETQCRENLWTRKTCFINKKFDCKCGLGKLFKTNEEALNYQDPHQGAKTKRKNALPALNSIANISDKTVRAKATAKMENHYLSKHSDDEMLPEPNPTKKILKICAKPHLANNNNESSHSNTPKSEQPEWLKEIIATSPTPEAISQRSKERLQEIRLAQQQQPKAASSPSTSSETSMSSKTSIDLGVGTSCSTSTLDISEIEQPEEPRYRASDEFFIELEILLTKIENSFLKLVF